ncbi:hemoglobin/transferrin/lactoferrin receptor protein [Agrobacterium larrymoorei]|uniref:Hemoglobin/transferrin/lactoferrin receptor protein n=1 Tax=Agrobacterium larrymoorei TaxID=160699 RepID=A0AAJ2BNW6_9HYPH|nr:TonB-dependent hemoglobin/transferrin/lactoferrin family receptor [Agrobacterium larrymoorei]MDR6102935.1 hemoglobin/transferrin/lactoferrin receptor protein [Agrobacterium larrymoorei]
MLIRGSQSALFVCTALALVFHSVSAEAQTASPQDGQQPTVLKRITIKGARAKPGNTASSDTPLASETTAEAIRKKDIGNLSDLGNTTEPGVDYVDPKPGKIGGLFIRGLGGARVVTMVDNIPIPFFENFARAGQATSTMSSGASSFDFSALSAVDVLRGSDSSRVGSGALAGALVLRTLEPEDLIGEGRDWGGVAKTTYDSEDRSIGGALAAARKVENTSVLFQGSYKRGHETDNKGSADIFGTSRTKPNPGDYDQNNLMFKLRQDLEGGHRIGVTAERYQLNSDTELKTLYGTYLPGAYSGYDDTLRERLSLDYEYEAPSVDAMIDTARLTAYWQALSKESGSGGLQLNAQPIAREDFMRDSSFGLVGGLTSTFDTGNLDHTVRIGGDASTFDFKEWFTSVTGSSAAASSADIPHVDGHRLGLYAEDEISFGASGFRLTPGIRFDYFDYDPSGDIATHSSYATLGLPQDRNGSRFSPKLMASYDLTPEVQVFAQWSTAYRAPTVNELYLSFPNIARGYAVVGNPYLEPETSNGFEIGAKYQSGDTTGGVTAFHNQYRNFIEQYQTTTALFPGAGGSPNGTLFTYRNRAHVEISGVEAKVRQEFSSGFFAHASLAYAYGKDTDNNELIRTVAPFKSIVGVGYANDFWGTELTGIFASGMRDDHKPATFDAPGYGIANLTAWWEPTQTKGLRIQAGVYNIFDRKYWNAVGVRDVNPTSVSSSNQPVDFYSEPGRSFKISLTQKF